MIHDVDCQMQNCDGTCMVPPPEPITPPPAPNEPLSEAIVTKLDAVIAVLQARPIYEDERANLVAFLSDDVAPALRRLRAPAPPPSGELARLLPGLAEDMATSRAVASLQLSGDGHREAVQRIADACELLLAERTTSLEQIEGADREARFQRERADKAGAARPEPHPLAGVVAEVLALGQRYDPDSESTPRDYLITIAEITDVDDPPTDLPTERNRLKMSAAVALAGIAACDGAKGGGT